MEEQRDVRVSIARDLIYSVDGVLLHPSDLISSRQKPIWENPAACDLLSMKYHKEFTTGHDRAYLDDAIHCSRQCLLVCPPHHPLRKKWLFRLANYLTSRCDRYKSSEGLDEAIELLQESLGTTTDQSSNSNSQEQAVDHACDTTSMHSGNITGYRRAKVLCVLARASTLRYQRGNSSSDFDMSKNAQMAACDIYRDLAMNESLGNVERLVAVLHEQRYLKNCEDNDSSDVLDNAIDWAERSVTTSKEFQGWGWSTDILADLLERRYERLKDQKDLHAAIKHRECLLVEVRTLGPHAGSWKDAAELHSSLGRLYLMLTSVTQSGSDGSEASCNMRLALRLTPADHPSRPERLRLMEECAEKLSNSVGLDIRGKATNVEVRCQTKRILQATDDPSLKATLLEELSSLHYSRYDSDESISELRLAQNKAIDAAEATPLELKDVKVRRFQGAALHCMELARCLIDDDFLDTGIDLSRKAVDIYQHSGSVSAASKAIVLANLTRIIRKRLGGEVGDSHKKMELIAEGLEAAKEAASLICQACTGDDDCQYCQDRMDLTEDLEEFQQMYG